MSEHTAEPWTFGVHENTGDIGILGPECAVAHMLFGALLEVPIPRDVAKANARRIVACVNACAGIPTEALERDAVKHLREALRDLRETTGRIPADTRSPGYGQVVASLCLADDALSSIKQ